MQNLIKTTDNGIMKFTELTAVSSKTIADVLGVSHRDLLLNVKKVEKYQQSQVCHRTLEKINDDDSLSFNPIFKDWEYQSRGRAYPCKIMNEDGAKALIKVIDTQSAYNYFAILMGEFNKMRQEREERSISKHLAQLMTDQVKRLQKKLFEEGSGSAPHIYTIISRQIHRAVTGRPMPKGGIDHDSLTLEENHKISEIRSAVKSQIKMRLDRGDTARDIRDAIRVEVSRRLANEMGNQL